ncbi:MAG: DinB family protein [Promethearchaeota archaeon]
MKDELINAISSGLHGDYTHTDPLFIIKGLTPTIARKKPKKAGHSCWELLHHIVVWQDILLRHIKGEELDWHEIESRDNWPTSEALEDDSNFWSLKNKFEADLNEVKTLLNDIDYTKKSKGSPELSTIKLLLVLLQHTSYHIGQIITVSQVLGEPIKPPTPDG